MQQQAEQQVKKKEEIKQNAPHKIFH